MPKDHWRFTAAALQQVFPSFSMLDEHSKMVITRNNSERDYALNSVMIPRYSKHPEETPLGYLLRRVSRRFFASGIFRVALFPEVAVYALGIRREREHAE